MKGFEKGDEVKVIDKNYSKKIRSKTYYVIGHTPNNFVQISEDPFSQICDHYMGSKQIEKIENDQNYKL